MRSFKYTRQLLSMTIYNAKVPLIGVTMTIYYAK